MKVFEFHFNPKLKEDLIVDSFCYEAEKPYEKKLGSLYMVGLLNNAMPQNKRLLKRLAEAIKEKHYSSKSKSPEKALKASLKQANGFLDKISKSGDVSWLGNLHFLILCIKDSKLYLSKVGDIKPLLVRGKHITDIEENIQLEEMEPYPVKIFANIVSGKLAENDLICVLTDKLFDYFEKEKILKKIANLPLFDGKVLKEVLNGKKQALSELTGVFLAIHFTKESSSGKKQTISQEDLEDFSLKKIFAPLTTMFEKLPKLNFEKPSKRKAKRKKSKAFQLPRIKLKIPKVKLKMPKKLPALLKSKAQKFQFNKNTVLVLGLAFLLVIGFAFSKFEQKRKMSLYAGKLEEIKETLELSESFLILRETKPEAFKKANQLLEQSWNQILPLAKDLSFLPTEFSSQVTDLKEQISNKLSELNRLEIIESPETVFEFQRREFVPIQMVSRNNNLYFSNPYSPNILILKQNDQTQIIETEKSVNLSTPLNGSIVFFSKPDQLIVLENDQPIKTGIAPHSQNPDLNSLVSYYNNLYFLDKTTGQIIKYGFIDEFSWDNPQSWLNHEPDKTVGAKSIAIDSSIWVLKENSLYKYYRGDFQQEIEFSVFPEVKEITKIHTRLDIPYLYLMEPIQKRMIVLNKAGFIIKQFQSEKFDNLLDFSVAEDGKTIYLLNGLKVYKIEL